MKSLNSISSNLVQIARPMQANFGSYNAHFAAAAPAAAVWRGGGGGVGGPAFKCIKSSGSFMMLKKCSKPDDDRHATPKRC